MNKDLVRLYKASRYLLDDLIDTGDDRNPETGKEYASCKHLRKVLKRLEKKRPKLRRVIA